MLHKFNDDGHDCDTEYSCDNCERSTMDDDRILLFKHADLCEDWLIESVRFECYAVAEVIENKAHEELQVSVTEFNAVCKEEGHVFGKGDVSGFEVYSRRDSIDWEIRIPWHKVKSFRKLID